MNAPGALQDLAQQGPPLALAEALLALTPTAPIDLPPHAVQGALTALLSAGRPTEAADLHARALTAGLALSFPNKLILALAEAGQRDAAHCLACETTFPGPPLPWHFITRMNLLEWTGAPELGLKFATEGAALFPKNGPLLAAHARLAFLTGQPPEEVARLCDAALPHAPADTLPLLQQLASLSRHGTADLADLTLSLPAPAVSPFVALTILSGHYEAAEIAAITQDITPDDRLLELGAGIGLVALNAARAAPGLQILAVEANPDLAPTIRRNFELNACDAPLISAIAALKDGEAAFHLAPDFWASSTEPGVGDTTVTRPTVDVNRLIAEFRPTILSMDIEGGEIALLPHLDLTDLRRLVIEFHPEHGPAAPISACIADLLAQGFVLDIAQGSPQVLVFDRAPAAPSPMPTGE